MACSGTSLFYSFLAWAPLFAGAVILLLGFAVWTAIRAARKRHWRSALSTLALPALLAASWPISNLTEPLVNGAHYSLFKAEYLSSIAGQGKMEGGQLMIFDWGGNAMVGFNRFLVFDESDETSGAPKADGSRGRSSSRYGGHCRTCCWLAPVANDDPKLT